MVTLTAKPKDGYRFVRWLEGTKAVSYNFEYTFMAERNRSLKAEFDKINTPTINSAVTIGNTNIRVKWKPVTGATGYNIYRSIKSNGVYTKIRSCSTTELLDQNLTTGIYYYKIKTFCTAGSVTTYGGFSKIMFATIIPSTPMKLIASLSGKSAVLSWQSVQGITKYEIWRSKKLKSGYRIVASTSSTSYLTKKLSKGKTYYYKVRAYKLIGKAKVYSKYSNIVNIKL